MNKLTIAITVAFLVASLPSWTLADTNLDHAAQAAAFLNKFCIDCHGPELQEADRSFSSLVSSANESNVVAFRNREAWREVLDRMNLGDMPPEDADDQPSAQQRLAVIELLTTELSRKPAPDEHESHAVALRRLNRTEYDHSVRRLLGLEQMLDDPTVSFPPDELAEGFTTVGQRLVISDFLMSKYLEAANAYLDAAFEKAKPVEPKIFALKAPYDPRHDQSDGQDREGEYQHLNERPSDHGGMLWLKEFGVASAAGHYRIRVHASAINRNHPYLDRIISVPKEDPLLLAIVATDATAINKHRTTNSTDVTLKSFEVRDDDPQWYEAKVWVDKGYCLRLAYPNGPSRVKYMRHQLMSNHRDSFPNFIGKYVHVFHTMHPDYDKGKGPVLAEEFLQEQERLKQAGKPYDAFGVDHSIHIPKAWATFYSEYQGPRVRVSGVEIEGPLPSDAGAEAANPYEALFNGSLRGDEVLPAIRRFASLAAGRPVDDKSFAMIAELFKTKQTVMSTTEATRLALKTILCGPDFIYHRTRSGPLDDYELARRLAYFLTQSPPDNRLIRLAAKGELSRFSESGEPSRLKVETQRLLSLPEHQNFVEAFANSWLKLSKLGKMPPDLTEHPEYFNEQLESAMRSETSKYLEEAIAKNRPVRWLVDGDQTFLNAPLARLYEVPGVQGLQMRQVKLTSSLRGGLLGHASILTASANGIDTSPVVRGVWVLECLLGTPPSPPPPDIEPLEPDTRGSTTIREQLSKHREVVSCRHCHQRIDPLGFALESFDEIGRFRTHYGSQEEWRNESWIPVDSSGQLPSGESFADISELRKLLVEKVPLVQRNLVSKLLVQATGRLDDPNDAADVLAICRDSPADGFGIRDLILEIVCSDAFRR
ncbi:hypothetical protein Poly51_50620 [Rubripirellula tenax]|uniref:Planctomycete cytochrome C n=1 Tax=Rubripirellula tenax TaxID=2528015 RepID=A0A5C6EBU8_9BACT|nr:DUF1588 domain-containing protein [Rubripirellula tenax]TWU47263.1 hypothetical protein Poly51_50620 [Rubripirellula tenax]